MRCLSRRCRAVRHTRAEAAAAGVAAVNSLTSRFATAVASRRAGGSSGGRGRWGSRRARRGRRRCRRAVGGASRVTYGRGCARGLSRGGGGKAFWLARALLAPVLVGKVHGDGGVLAPTSARNTACGAASGAGSRRPGGVVLCCRRQSTRGRSLGAAAGSGGEARSSSRRGEARSASCGGRPGSCGEGGQARLGRSGEVLARLLALVTVGSAANAAEDGADSLRATGNAAGSSLDLAVKDAVKAGLTFCCRHVFCRGCNSGGGSGGNLLCGRLFCCWGLCSGLLRCGGLGGRAREALKADSIGPDKLVVAGTLGLDLNVLGAHTVKAVRAEVVPVLQAVVVLRGLALVHQHSVDTLVVRDNNADVLVVNVEARVGHVDVVAATGDVAAGKAGALLPASVKGVREGVVAVVELALVGEVPAARGLNLATLRLEDDAVLQAKVFLSVGVDLVLHTRFLRARGGKVGATERAL